MKKTSNLKKTLISVLLIITLVITVIPSHSFAKAKKVKLNKTKVILYVGKTTTLKLKNNKKKIKWSSSNKKIATVSKKGKVKAKKKGKATITAKVGKKKYKCKVTVKVKTKKTTTYTQTPKVTPTAKPTQASTSKPTPTLKPTITPLPKVQSISFEKSEIEIKHGFGVDVKLVPYPAENSDFTKYSGASIAWKVSNPDFLRVDATYGYLEARIYATEGMTGTATVTATVYGRDISATCTVTVPDEEAELELSEDGTTVLDVTNTGRATVINIPDTVTTIGWAGLRYCKYVKTLEIPSSVTTIEGVALPSELKSIYIPSSVTYISSQDIDRSGGCIIYGEAGSYAEQWAKDRGNTFIAK